MGGITPDGELMLGIWTWVTRKRSHLLIDIINWNEKELSWGSNGKGVVPKASSDKDEEQLDINKIVAKILEDFPPGSAQTLMWLSIPTILRESFCSLFLNTSPF